MAKVTIEEKITCLIEKSVRELALTTADNKPLPANFKAQMEIPKKQANGDLTTNAAMRLSGFFKMPPMSIAEKIRDLLRQYLSESSFSGAIAGVEAVKPGFVNLRFSNEYLWHTLETVNRQGAKYGAGQKKTGRKVQIEFVSANPTGPLTVAHGRQAAVGDALGRILTFYGSRVSKEYFVNDEGRQISLLGESILHHYLSFYGIDHPFPEDGYRGDYIRDIAEEIKKTSGDRFIRNFRDELEFFSKYGCDHILRMIKESLRTFDVNFDSWFSQRKLTADKIHKVLRELRGKGFVYDKEGAVWFRSTAFGDEKDRVVIKSDGTFTYFAPDIAYHRDKYRRGIVEVVNIWGPDHHGYIPRLKAAVQAMGYSPESVSVLIVQLATLYRNGEVLSMSTRKGEFITLDEVVREVGKDVTKYFFLMRKLDSHLDFDLELAKRQSADNPVFYIQYAHARIWSILSYGDEDPEAVRRRKVELDLLKEPEELDLARRLARFPAFVRDSALNLEPYYLLYYLNDLATAFHGFYTKHKVISENAGLSMARVFLVNCVRICLANGLGLLGISLPKKM